MIVHFLQFGHTPCMMEGIPKDWPTGHWWSGNWSEVTCPHCIKGKDIAPTFSISEDGKSITCLRCKRTSFHPKDVENRYCGACHVSHDDIWPPARRWWVEHPDPARITAPFTPDQVAGLKAWQECDWVHEFTCCSQAMAVEERGFVCGKCGRVQTWAHRFMAFGAPDHPFKNLIEGGGA